MAHKLKGKALEYVALNLQECKKYVPDKRKMYVSVADSSAGPMVCQYLMNAYGGKSYDKILWGWGDFVIKFDTVTARDNAVADVNAAVIDYFETHGDEPTPEPETPTPTVTVESEEEKPDYTTYIIIGVAVVAIIILLLWKK